MTDSMIAEAATCPFAHGVAFDPFKPEMAGEPYDWLKVAREDRPVFYLPQHDLWCVTRYEDCNAIMRNPEQFSNSKAIKFENMSEDMAAAFPEGPPDRVLVTLDPPEHTRLRRLAQAAFSNKLVEAKRAGVRALADQLIDGFINDRQADIVPVFCDKLPVAAITLFVGAPQERTPFFRQWAVDRLQMLKGAPDFSPEERATLIKRALDFTEWLREFVEKRRENPEEDFASALIYARTPEGDAALTMPEILGLIATVLGAGSTSTAHLFAMMFKELLTNRESWEELKRDRSLVRKAIEEVLRIRSPVHGALRVTKDDVEVCGVKIPKDSDVYLYYASAQRDETVFEDPDSFDIHRKGLVRSIPFGRFVHVCLGASLARMEAEEVLNAFLDRLPDLRIAADQHDEWVPNILSPGLTSLKLEW